MAMLSTIEKYGLAEEAVKLYFDGGLGVIETAARLTGLLPEEIRAQGVSITQPAMSRFLAKARDERYRTTATILKDHVASNLPSDLDTLSEVKGFFLHQFRKPESDLKTRSAMAMNLVKVVDIRCRLATAVDSGDKTEVLKIVKNEVAQITNHFGGQAAAGGLDLSRFSRNPAAFGEVVLGESYTEDVKRVFDSVVKNPVTVAISANAVGKTHAAARIALWWYKTREGAQVYTAAAPPEKNLKTILWGEISSLVRKHPGLFQGDTIRSLEISRGPQEAIYGVTIPTSGTKEEREGKFSGKHAPELLFILDEGDAIPDEIYSGIESCMSGGNARLLIMFNPRGAMGHVRRLVDERRAAVVSLSAFRHPNVVEGRDVIPGAVTREQTVKRVCKWCRPLVDQEPVNEECFELPAFLEGAAAMDDNGEMLPPLTRGWYKIVEPAFSYMVLGQYPAVANQQLISPDWLAAARSRFDTWMNVRGNVPPEGVSPVAGLDVAEYGADLSMLCFRYGGFVPPLVVAGRMDTDALADAVKPMCDDRGAIRLNVDGTGVGSGVAPKVNRKGLPSFSVILSAKPTKSCEFGSFQILRDQLLWSIREWLRTDPGAMLPPDQMLLDELRALTYDVDPKGIIHVTQKDVIKELLKRSPDRLMALAMTFFEPEVVYA